MRITSLDGTMFLEVSVSQVMNELGLQIVTCWTPYRYGQITGVCRGRDINDLIKSKVKWTDVSPIYDADQIFAMTNGKIMYSLDQKWTELTFSTFEFTDGILYSVGSEEIFVFMKRHHPIAEDPPLFVLRYTVQPLEVYIPKKEKS